MANVCIGVLLLLPARRRIEAWLLATVLMLSAGIATLTASLTMLNAQGASAQAIATVLAARVDLAWPIGFVAAAMAVRLARPEGPGLLERRASYALLALGAALTGLVIVAKPWFYDASDGFAQTSVVTFLLDDVMHYVLLVLILVALAAGWARSRPGSRESLAARLLFLGFAVGPVVGVAPSAPYLLENLDRFDPSDWRAVKAIGGPFLDIAIGALLVGCLVHAHRRGQSVRFPSVFFAGLVAAGLAATTIPTAVDVVGVWYGEAGLRVLRPIILLVAIAQHDLFGIELRRHRHVATPILMALVGIAFLPAEEITRAVIPLAAELAVPAAIAAGIAASLCVHALVRGWNERAGEEEALERMRRSLAQTPTPGGASPQDAPEVGALVLGRYRVEAVLGEGGGGRTYRALDTRLGRHVAVKETRPSGSGPAGRERALREARLLASVHDPHVVALYEVHEAGSTIYLVMEYVPGGSLAQRLGPGRPLVADDARRVLDDVLAGLDALHRAGLVHRDVKPSNVLLDANGRAKLADLGIARERATESTVTQLRAPGTPAYMAPEQVLDLPVDERTDVYASAALLYETLVGEPYVRHASMRGVLLEEIIVSRAPPLPVVGAPAWANAYLARGLAKEPEDRFPSAADARLALAPPGAPRELHGRARLLSCDDVEAPAGQGEVA